MFGNMQDALIEVQKIKLNTCVYERIRQNKCIVLNPVK